VREGVNQSPTNRRAFPLHFQNARIGIGIFSMAAGDHFLEPRLHEMLRYSQEELEGIEQGARYSPGWTGLRCRTTCGIARAKGR
jgi:hypothetical protein